MKIAITRTPLQNNVEEYYTIIRFVHPKFGKEFPKNIFSFKFTEPITEYMKVKDDKTLNGIQEEGKLALERLIFIVQPFFLRRRRNGLVQKDKTEYLICCKMDTALHSRLQLDLYNAFVRAYRYQKHRIATAAAGRHSSIKSEGETIHVNYYQAMYFLKFLCAHPQLVADQIIDWHQDKTPFFENLYSIYQEFDDPESNGDPTLSTKMSCLLRLLKDIHEDPATKTDRVVIVSYYTIVLDAIEQACDSKGYKHVRYDGSSSAGKKREENLKNCNDPSKPNNFIMLLSCRAGGCGISLVGANHLVMFDPDWNPFNDEQAMSQIYRNGQSKDCHVYRLLTTGSIEEAQFWKQVSKQLLAGQVLNDSVKEKGRRQASPMALGIFNDQEKEDSDVDALWDSDDEEEEEKDEGFQEREGKDDLKYLEEEITEKNSKGLPMVSLTHDDIDCRRCETEVGIQIKPVDEVARSREEGSEELNLHLWEHVFTYDDIRYDLSTMGNAWSASRKAISMVFYRTLKADASWDRGEIN